MKIISFLNIKGGVAKTVSTVNVAAELGKQGEHVLVIDLDPQSNSTKYLNLYNPNGESSYDLLNGEEVHICTTKYQGVCMIPANIKLIASESEILADTKKARETRLKKWIKSVEDQFDYILIDCPPSLGMISINALTTSDYVLVPLKIDKFSLDGFEYLINSINSIKEEFNEKLNLLGVFVTMDRATKINKDIKQELQEELGDLLFKQSIRENVDVIKSTFESTPVVYFNKKCNAAKDYKAFVEELKCRII